MGLKDILANFQRPKDIDAKASRAGPMIAWSQVGQPRWTPRSYQNFAAEGFRKNVIAYRCVMQIATACAAIPLVLYDDQGNELDNHPLLNLLDHPNPLQDGVTFMESVYANLEIAGNAYIEAVQSDDYANDGTPVELYVLRPDRMKVIPGASGLPQGYQYEVGTQKTVWPCDPITGASNILHIKKFNPLDDWYGLAPMEAASISVDQHNSASSWNQALLNQGARPSGALVYAPKEGPNTLSEDQVRRLREELGQLYQGDRNAGRPLILEGGLEWREMSLSPKDMDWLAGRNAAARDIALAFGVPAQLVGVPDTQTYSNFAEARLAFYEETVIPLVTRVVSGFNHWLQPMYDNRIDIDFDLDNVSALAAKRYMLWDKLQNADFLTLNEKREAANYGPLANGDRVKNFRPRSRATRSTSTQQHKDDESDSADGYDDGGVQTYELADNGPSHGASGGWGDPSSLQKHFGDHGEDFDSESPEHYARQANDFYQRFQDEDLPAVEGMDGRIRTYDPDSNTFGVFNNDGTTASFFKPEDGVDYFLEQIDRDLGFGGRIINPLPENSGGGGGVAGGGLPHIGKPGFDRDGLDDEVE